MQTKKEFFLQNIKKCHDWPGYKYLIPIISKWEASDIKQFYSFS